MEFYQGEYGGLIEFSANIAENPFGATLLSLVEEQYDDIDTAVLDIAETLSAEGYAANEEVVLGLMTGEILPEEEVVEILADLGEVAGDDIATQRNQAKLVTSYNLLLDSIELDEDEDEDEVDEDTDEVSYEITEEIEEDEDEVDEEAEAAFSRYFEQQEAIQERMTVTDTLSELRDYAEELRSKKCLTPHAFNMLFSRRSKDDYMNFSQAIDSTDYTPEEYLLCMDFALNLFEELGPMPGTAYQFSNIVEQDVEDAPINFSSQDTVVDEEARDLLNLLHGVKQEAE